MAALNRGRVYTKEVEISDFRTLSRADLTALAESRPVTTLQTLRDTHHRVARTVAAGLPNWEVAQICGIAISSISRYRADPAFMELVAHYRGLITAEFVRSTDSFMEIATGNMLKAATLISDRLDEAMDEGGKPIPLNQLVAIQDTGADRFGYGKMQKNLNVNVDFAAQLEAARKRSAEASREAYQPSPITIEHSGADVKSLPADVRSGADSDPHLGQPQPSFRRL